MNILFMPMESPVFAVSYWKYPDWAPGDHSNRLGPDLDSVRPASGGELSGRRSLVALKHG